MTSCKIPLVIFLEDSKMAYVPNCKAMHSNSKITGIDRMLY